jgi:hypothetical protein
MKSKINITDGKVSMSFPSSSLEMVYAKQTEIIAYFRGANDKKVRVVIDVDEFNTNEYWVGLGKSESASWVFDDLCERYGEVKVKRIDILNANGSATSL